MKEKGYIRLNRGFFEHTFWQEDLEYHRREAWLDLIQLARFEAREELIQGKLIEVRRGELPASRRYLEKRWKWSGNRVVTFLKMLERSGMIKQRKNQGQTIIILYKYDDYNDLKNEKEPPTNHQRTTNEPRYVATDKKL